MLEITPVPAFSDNYLWLAWKTGTRGALIVDPGDADPVIQALEARDLRLEAILVTHHHFDHTGGLAQLVERFGATVYGPENPGIKGIEHRLADGDRIDVLDTYFQIIAVPGHTLDHIAYYAATPGGDPLVFCGDTLFAGGCGRLFEGSPEQMDASLRRLGALPPATRVYCAHEYTLANLRFANAVEPENEALTQRIAAAGACRERGQPTVPSTVELELATNPFMRCREPAVVEAAARREGHGVEPGSETLASIRRWKDAF